MMGHGGAKVVLNLKLSTILILTKEKYYHVKCKRNSNRLELSELYR
jgi:hypothetical protein